MGMQSQRVLVADPCLDTVDSFACLLRCWGHEVCTAQDGATARQLAARFRPTVVMSEVRLCKLDGYELARQLRRMDDLANALLVAVSGGSTADFPKQARAAGFDCYLLKPADPEVLRRLLVSAAPPFPECLSPRLVLPPLSRSQGVYC